MGYFKQLDLERQELDAAMRSVTEASYVGKMYEELLFSHYPKMETFVKWRPVLSAADRVRALEQALDYELWLELKSKQRG